MMLVKICGIRTIGAALASLEAGADFLGFVFAKSKRQVTVTEAIQINKQLPHTVKTVGVFVDTPISEINQMAGRVNFDYVQLHGHETVADCLNSQVPVIKALSIRTESDLGQVEDYLPVVDYLLIDGPEAGSGEVFDWGLIDSIPSVREKLILAGGLTPNNVIEAISQVQPVGVDVSSGVETGGIKDVQKIKQFILNVKGVR
ncbi:phosphoribosylanthranilate isomerase [Amphibacillus sp. MSJ-3]|nr:phosphoribosylanthranilate isomerase [Amphibacillus sp. MSJ-3]MBU5595691.1 phosphoribosylanthranilate isomerase [Amphibacillus sp. MSJ-3]